MQDRQPQTALYTTNGPRQSRGAPAAPACHVLPSPATASALVKTRPAQQEAAKRPAAAKPANARRHQRSSSQRPARFHIKHGSSHNRHSVCSTCEPWICSTLQMTCVAQHTAHGVHLHALGSMLPPACAGACAAHAGVFTLPGAAAATGHVPVELPGGPQALFLRWSPARDAPGAVGLVS